MNNNKIALFGTAETTMGLAKEALERGHQVIVIVPDDNEFNLNYSNLKIANGDMKKKEDVVKYSKGSDVVICVYDPADSIPGEHADTTRAIIDGLKDAGVNHLVYATRIDQLKEIPKRSREESQEPEHSGVHVEVTPEQPTEFKSEENVHREAIKILQSEKGLNWGYAHAGKSENKPGADTGKEIRYTHPDGEKLIPVKEYISSIIDEAEKEEVEVDGHYKVYNNKKRQS
jgi:putative NADH-flavin reductase